MLGHRILSVRILSVRIRSFRIHSARICSERIASDRIRPVGAPFEEITVVEEMAEARDPQVAQDA